MQKIITTFGELVGSIVETVGNCGRLVGCVIQGIGVAIETGFGFVAELPNKVKAKIEENANNKKGKYEEQTK